MEGDNDLNLTPEQFERLYQQFAAKLRMEDAEQKRNEHFELPTEIQTDLDKTSSSETQQNIKRYIRELPQYEGGIWTSAETINKVFIPDLKRYQIDAYQVVTQRYKDADKIRHAAKAATDIYEDLIHFATNGGDEATFANIVEKARRMAVYGFSTAKTVDTEARDLATKALRLPQSLKYLEDPQDDNKRLAFSPEIVEKISQARYESAILQKATSKDAETQEDALFLAEPSKNPTIQRSDTTQQTNCQQPTNSDHQRTTSVNSVNSVNITIQYKPINIDYNNNSTTNSYTTTHQPCTLHRSNGWDLARWEIETFLTILAIYCTTSLAIISYFSRIQNTVGLQSYPVEIKTATTRNRRTASRRRRRSTVPRGRYYRNITKSRRTLPVQLLHSTGTDKTETHPRLSETKRVCTMRPLQDGRCAGITRNHRRRRLAMQVGLKRCVYRSAYSRRLKTFSFLQAPKRGLSVSRPSFWSKRGSKNIFKDHAIRNRTFKGRRHPYGLLFGRYLPPRKIQTRNGNGNIQSSHTLNKVRISNQLAEEHSGTIDNARLFGFSIQHKNNEDHSASTQDQQSTVTDQAIEEDLGAAVMPLDCKSFGENDLNDTSCRRSTPSHSVSPEGPQPLIVGQQEQMGQPLQVEYEEQGRPPMVGAVVNNEERSTDPSTANELTEDRPDDSCRRVGYGLGGELEQGVNVRILDPTRKRTLDKCSGADDDSLCPPVARSKRQKLLHQDLHGQHHRSKIRDQGRRHFFGSTSRFGHQDTRDYQSTQSSGILSTHSGGKQHPGGFTEQTKNSSLRVEATQEMVSTDTEEMGETNNRRLCGKTQQPIAPVLESQSGSSSKCSRRLSANLAQEGFVPSPSVETHSQSASHVQETTREGSDFGDTVLEDSVLVSHGTPVDKRSPSPTTGQQEMDISRLEVIEASKKNNGLDEDVLKFLRNATRKRTHQLYNRGWSLWSKWCQDQHPKINPLEYEEQNVVKFLVSQKQYSSQYLNVLRSSIASVFKVIHKNKPPIAQQPLVQEFFSAKRRSEVTLPTKQKVETWDLDILLQHMVKKFEDNDSLTLEELQEKVILLLCISTMWRPRSDIGTLQLRDIEFSFENEGSSTSQQVTGVTIHIREPKEAQTKTTRLGVLKVSHMCPVVCLYSFISRTQSLRVGLPNDHTVFLAYLSDPSKVKSISQVTVANIVKKNMAEAGIDTKTYGPHTIRSASSTKAVQLGHDIQKIKEHANWSLSANTFERFYYKPTYQESASAHINNTIFSFAADNHTISEVRLESTGIGLSTTSNAKVDERRTKDMVHPTPWYRKLFDYF
ncbi:hypothetical protein G6F39_010639 [Rhizopus arrhizus]|nr:hypothetical protein G6F39_010639 [Rhizopus arrhizus]